VLDSHDDFLRVLLRRGLDAGNEVATEVPSAGIDADGSEVVALAGAAGDLLPES
jgi:hypothetical protein